LAALVGGGDGAVKKFEVVLSFFFLKIAPVQAEIGDGAVGVALVF